jgi:hypothetical protein
MTSPNKLILEPATPDDIPTMIDIWFAAFTDPTMQRLWPDTSGVREWWEDANRREIVTTCTQGGSDCKAVRRGVREAVGNEGCARSRRGVCHESRKTKRSEVACDGVLPCLWKITKLQEAGEACVLQQTESI